MWKNCVIVMFFWVYGIVIVGKIVLYGVGEKFVVWGIGLVFYM